MLKIIEERCIKLFIEYLLSEEEIKNVIEKIKKIENMPKHLRSMFKEDNKNRYASKLLLPLILETIKQRKLIQIPSEDEILKITSEILISENNENINNTCEFIKKSWSKSES